MATKRNKKRRIRQLIAACIILLIALLFYTILSAQPKELSFGVLSFDGAVYDKEGEKGDLSEKMLDNLTSGDVIDAISDNGKGIDLNSYSIEFKSYATQEELDEALKNDSVQGAIVVPEDYTRKQITETTTMVTDTATSTITNTVDTVTNIVTDTVESTTSETTTETVDETATGSSEAYTTSEARPEGINKQVVNVIMNTSSNPELNNKVKDAISGALDAAGLESEVYATNSTSPQREVDELVASPFSHLLLLLPPLICGILLAWIYRTRSGIDVGERIKRVGISVLLDIPISLLLAIVVYTFITIVLGYPSDALPSIFFLWITYLLLMIFAEGLADFSVGVAAIVVAALVLLGGLFGFFNPDSLSFTIRQLIYPWLTTTFTDVGLSHAVTRGCGSWIAGMNAVWIYTTIGVAFAIVSSTKGIDGSAKYR